MSEWEFKRKRINDFESIIHEHDSRCVSVRNWSVDILLDLYTFCGWVWLSVCDWNSGILRRMEHGRFPLEFDLKTECTRLHLMNFNLQLANCYFLFITACCVERIVLHIQAIALFIRQLQQNSLTRLANSNTGTSHIFTWATATICNDHSAY